MTAYAIISTAWSWLSGKSSTAVALAAALVVAALLAGLLWFRAEAAEARGELQATRTALDAERIARAELMAASELRERALAEREAALESITNERAELERRLREAVRNDEAVRTWVDTPLPARVRELLAP